MKQVVAITPIKYTSTRLARKNFLKLGERPLYHYATNTISQLPIWPSIDQLELIPCIYCDSYTWEQIDETTKQSFAPVREQDAPVGQDGNQLFQRMAQDFIHQYPNCDVDWFFFFNVTSPFVGSQTYLEVLDTMCEGDKYDSACTVLEITGRMWQLEERGGSIPILQEPSKCQRTQDQKSVYLESEACWLVRPEMILNHRRRVGYYPKFVPVNQIEATDINYPIDMETAKKWVKKL
jgi:CMP-N-acetylneuraminic acid synthetase